MANEEQANKASLGASRGKSHQQPQLPPHQTEAFSPRNHLNANKERANNSRNERKKKGGKKGASIGQKTKSVAIKRLRHMIIMSILGAIIAFLPFILMGLFVIFTIAVIAASLGLI